MFEKFSSVEFHDTQAIGKLVGGGWNCSIRKDGGSNRNMTELKVAFRNFCERA